MKSLQKLLTVAFDSAARCAADSGRRGLHDGLQGVPVLHQHNLLLCPGQGRVNQGPGQDASGEDGDDHPVELAPLGHVDGDGVGKIERLAPVLPEGHGAVVAVPLESNAIGQDLGHGARFGESSIKQKPRFPWAFLFKTLHSYVR